MLSLTSCSPFSPLPLGAALQATCASVQSSMGLQAGRQAHITRERVNILLIEVRLPGFPAKTAEHGFLLGIVPDPVRRPSTPFLSGVCWRFAGCLRR